MNISSKLLTVAVIALMAVACKDSSNSDIDIVRTKDIEGNYIGSIEVMPYNAQTNKADSVAVYTVQDTVAMVLDKAIPDLRVRCFSKKLGEFYLEIDQKNSDRDGGYIGIPIQSYTGPGANLFGQTSTLNTQENAYFDRHSNGFNSIVVYHRYSNSKVVATNHYKQLYRIR